MVVKTPFPVSLLLTAESFLNIPKSELFILNSKPEIGASAFRRGIKKKPYKNWTTPQPFSLNTWGRMVGGGSGKKMRANIITIVTHLQIFKRVKVNVVGCGFFEELKPEMMLVIKTKGKELWH